MSWQLELTGPAGWQVEQRTRQLAQGREITRLVVTAELPVAPVAPFSGH